MRIIKNCRLQTMRSLFFLVIIFCFISCGRSKTEDLIKGKKWEVYDVTPPAGVFNIEDANRASDLKNGFYKEAWFKFLSDGIFVASFEGKADTGRYQISSNGKMISLYPKHGKDVYEQIQIQHLTNDKMDFNTIVADFNLVLHLKTE